jgi:hypothetical protein
MNWDGKKDKNWNLKSKERNFSFHQRNRKKIKASRANGESQLIELKDDVREFGFWSSTHVTPSIPIVILNVFQVGTSTENVKSLKESIKHLAPCDSSILRVHMSVVFTTARQSAEEGRNDKKYPTMNEKEDRR